MANRRKFRLHKRRRSRLAMFLDEEEEETYGDCHCGGQRKWDNTRRHWSSDGDSGKKSGTQFHDYLTSAGFVDRTGELSDGELAGQIVGEIKRLADYSAGCFAKAARRIADAFG